MSAVLASTIYFHVDRLTSGFADNIERAFSGAHIVDAEYQQLKKLLACADSEDFTGSGLRVDRLITDSDVPINEELASALLISHSSPGDNSLYLDTLLHGLERFDDRDSLLQALNGYTLAGAQPTFEYQIIEAQLFTQRMQMIVGQQVDHLRELAARLQEIPSIDAALARALKLTVHDVLPDADLDRSLSLPLVQIFRSDQSSSRSNVYNQTLTQAAMDGLVGKPLPAHHYRAYLNGLGQTVDAAQAKRYEKVLADALKALVPVYESSLSDYWQHAYVRAETPRMLTAQALASGFRQELLHARHNGLLSADEFAQWLALPGPVGTLQASVIEPRRLALVIGQQQPVKLVGVFLANGRQSRDLIMYSARHGIRRFATLQAISDHFATTAGRAELQCYVSLNDLALLQVEAAWRIDLYAIVHPLFIDCIDAIIGLQKRNLGYVLTCAFADEPSACAMIEDALDVSYLIDRRLGLSTGYGRWMGANMPFAERWLPLPSTNAGTEATALPKLSEVMTWKTQLAAMEAHAQWLERSHITIDACARQLLNEYLAIFGEPGLDAMDIRVTLPDVAMANEVNDSLVSAADVSNEPSGPFKLIDLLLEKVSGHRPERIHADASFTWLPTEQAHAEPLALLTVPFINRMFELIAPGLAIAYLREVHGFYSQPLRLDRQQVVPATVIRRFMEDALRLECDVQRRLQKIEPRYISMLEQVLNRPVHSLRNSRDEDAVGVYSVALEYAKEQAPAVLSQFFILQRPLHSHDKIICWSALSGLQLFDSLAALGVQLNQWLSTGVPRESWLQLLSEPQRSRVLERLALPAKAALVVRLTRIEGDFIDGLQQIEYRRQCTHVQYALEDLMQGRIAADLMRRFTTVAQADQLMSGVLGGLSMAIQAIAMQDILPSWLLTADSDELTEYLNLLKRFYLSNDPDEDFMADVPSLHAFARAQLIKRLNTDYRGQLPDPDHISVTVLSYVPGFVPLGETPSAIAATTLVNRESLTEFALNHFSIVQGAVLIVKLPGDLPLPQFIPADYFKSLVRSLDVGEQYRNLLATVFAENSESYTSRRKRFVAQIPSRLLLLAFEMKLQKQLSAKAYGYLRNVVEMPDGIARQPDDKEDVVLRPLQLLAADDMAPDPVAGIYVIGPRDVSKGPIILHALFNDTFSLKEYATEAQLLLDLQQPGSLQTLVLARIDPLLHRRYDHGGFLEAHIPWSSEGVMDGPGGTPGPTRLMAPPVSGNALNFWFAETIKVLKHICMQQTVTTAEADWSSFVYLMGLGGEQVLSFVPGKVGFLLAAWQGQAMFNAFVVSVDDRRWGKALSQFTAAIGLFMVTRRSAEVEVHGEGAPLMSETSAVKELPEFLRNNTTLTPELNARLCALQVHDIVLNEQQHDSLNNLYQNPITLKQYAAIAGHVYEVTFEDNQWHVIGPNGRGPHVRLNADLEWELQLGLMGGGGQTSHVQPLDSNAFVERVIFVEAQGMKDIRLFSQVRADLIAEASFQARTYLENCLYNLVPARIGGPIDHLSRQVISEFFGIDLPSRSLIRMIRKKATKLYLAITDSSLSAATSNRFVVGTNKPGHERTLAFVSMIDPQRRIFMTEVFFETPDMLFKIDHSQQGGFNYSAHYRAATLIHELSHLVHKTHDIAYLNSSLPFVDLLDTGSLRGKNFKEALQELRETSLSHKTPIDKLFCTYEASGWRDINIKEGRATVLKITGTTTLEAARKVFMIDARKRAEIMLFNADSLALLIMELGRKRVGPL